MRHNATQPMARNAGARISTLIVDDEPIARAGLRNMLAEVDWIDCVGEAANGPAAIAAIDVHKPDLVFLDVQMPGLSGIEVLHQLSHRPFVIFTTAFAEHAVTAFELGALDYLLKPFGAERLLATLDRVRGAFGEPVIAALERLGDTIHRGPITRLFVRSGRSIVPVNVAEVRWFEAVGDYIAAHVTGGQHILHLSLTHLESRLDPVHFSRIHRTHIVNLDYVTAFRREAGGGLVAELKNGERLQVSRAKAQNLRGIAR